MSNTTSDESSPKTLMFFEEIIRLKDLSLGERLVLSYVLDLTVESENGSCDATDEELAEFFSVPVRQIKRCMSVLFKKKYLTPKYDTLYKIEIAPLVRIGADSDE